MKQVADAVVVQLAPRINAFAVGKLPADTNAVKTAAEQVFNSGVADLVVAQCSVLDKILHLRSALWIHDVV